MEYLQARLDSFSKSKRSKASSTRHTSSSSKWPHPSSFKATPDSLSEAGFYFDPDPANPDNVTCFMCKKGVAGWEPEDDPFSIHYDKCAKTCAWAMVRCQGGAGGESYDLSDPARHPTSKAMEKARLETFSKVSWPHDAVNGHGANSKALAKAGFICNSTEPGDDTALCLYCNLTLSGWDDDDDPYDEHLKRDKKKGTSCMFLRVYASNPLGKSTAKRPASKAAPKAPLRSASQTLRKTAAQEATDTAADSDDELAATPSDTYAPRPSSGRQSKASSARASSVTAKTPASRRSTRGTSTTGKTPGSRTVSSDVEETEGGSESDAGRRSGKAKKKASGRTKARVSAIAEEEDEAAATKEATDEDIAMQELEPEPEPEPEQDPPKKKRGRPPRSTAAKTTASTKKKVAVAQGEAEDPVAETDAEPAPPPPAKKTHARTRSKANMESETEAAPSSSTRTHTRTKSGSKAKVKQGEEDEVPVISAPAPKKKGKQVAAKTEDEEEEEPASARPKKLKGRAVSKSKAKAEPPASDMDDVVPGEKMEEEGHARTETGRSATSRSPKPSHESKSSLSEDAGYATAEPPPDADQMDIDEPSHPSSRPPKKLEALEPVKAEARARTVSRSKPANSDSSRQPSPAANAIRSSSEASSSRSSATRPPSKLNKDSLKVIEIDSDGEETHVHGLPAKPAAKGKAPVSRMASTSSANGVVKKPASQGSKKKLKVEVVVPPQPPRSQTKEVEMVDVQMQEQPPTSPVRTQPAREVTPSVFAELEPPGPSTPVSAVHRSALPSPVRESDACVPSPEAEDVGTAPKSPRAFHPFLAQLPIEKLASLTEEETEMTLEQYIRREMEIQYAQLKADGERRIDEFKQKAIETKKLIESS
ncbi:hypothetical protein L226DRAFT_609580 [Lentinus tigrinus ALCF2SS1-7]|uniref:BIR-domain-containing protein n=1 Tax=Lentinus tigrinus ALCF2SS1-6 TaxID=1328759 RepID=A0A5C2SQI5_9APHY|nr:hypothetical protein L227DRAFT_494260 [Lentinus tigrinus ALCF2SS1-6]RPD78996.1 hypothetical protein L226DRAFT_609580 [Lentinus tigrinus ALCF2SS1-7]